MRNHKVAFIAIALIVGCGGESTSSNKTTTPSADVARTAGGEAITTADGNAVSKKAHGKWESALDEFDVNEKAGWTSAKCGASEKSFERAADAQGGKVGILGPALDLGQIGLFSPGLWRTDPGLQLATIGQN